MKVNNTRAIVLAAGKSSRFKTQKSKLIYSICGQPMILYPVKLLRDMGIPTTVVLGYKAEEIGEAINDSEVKVDFVLQEEQLGTGNAIEISRPTWDEDNILVLYGDAPLLTEELLQNLIDKHKKSESVITFLSAHSVNPYGYGRVIRDGKNISIVEEKNCTDEQGFETLVNSGIYLIKKDFLKENIGNIKRNEVSGEYYITDLVGMASEKGLKVKTIPVPFDNIRGVNTLEELWAVEQIKRSQSIRHWMRKGVQFELAQNIHVDWNVEIGAGSFIGTGVHLIKGTKIGKNCHINAFSILENCEVGDNTHVHSHTIAQDSKIGNNTHVGPFARLRNNVVLGNNVSIGNFVEIKNSQLGDNTNTKHLTYLGDSKIGNQVNIGAGTITCNYDGFSKHQTTIEDNSFIGSNNTLVAPVIVEKDSYTAAGSTITKDVVSGSLAIARSKQVNKLGYSSGLKDRMIRKKKEREKNKVVKKKKKTKIRFIGAVSAKNSETNL